MTTVFDPFNATIDDAREALKQGNKRALLQWAAASMINARKAHFEKQPIDAIAECVMNDMVAPDWLAVAFIARWRDVRHFRLKSWDDAFGLPHAKGTNLAAQRRAKRNTAKVIEAYAKTITENPDMPIDKGFWDLIGNEIDQSGTRAEQIWRDAYKAGRTTITKDYLRPKAKR